MNYLTVLVGLPGDRSSPAVFGASLRLYTMAYALERRLNEKSVCNVCHTSPHVPPPFPAYGGKPKPQDFVVVSYKVRTTDGVEVAASSEGGATLPMSSPDEWEVSGLWEAVQTMQHKETVHLKLGPQCKSTWGAAGCGRRCRLGRGLVGELSELGTRGSIGRKVATVVWGGGV